MQDPTKALATRVNALANQVFERVENLRVEHVTNVSLLTRLTAHLGIIALVLIALLLSGIQIQAQTQPKTYDASTTSSDLPSINLDSTNNQGDLLPSTIVNTAPAKKDRLDVTKYVVKPGDNVSVIAARFCISPDSVI